MEHTIFTMAAFHPDWQLLLDALYTALAQPSILAEEVLSGGFLNHLSTLTLQLKPNSAAQQTAAAIVCHLSEVQIEAATNQPNQQGSRQQM